MTLFICRDYAKMCIPDVDVLADYPIDYKFPIFLKDANGKSTSSGYSIFFSDLTYNIYFL